jgi:alkanesulfonate monooxygenase SsuD/methylene tetrahydromethanopterin reductase-like flavin-dependent oxidoreductase (luciferase family)
VTRAGETDGVRLGVLLMPTDPWAATVDTAQRHEALGYHHLWVYDHLSWQRYRDRPWHATHPWLAGLAARTECIRLGTMVSNLNLRHPYALAKDVMTLDHISHGRLTLGLGAAGTGFDATVFGQAELTPGERVDRLDEAARLVDGLLRGEVRNHHGSRYEVRGARMLPGCVQSPRVPIAIAAGGRRTLRLTADVADAWITLGSTSGADESASATERTVRDQAAQLDEHCATLGRDPSDLDRVFLAGHSAGRPLESIEAFTDFVGRYRAIGITDIVFHHPREDDPVLNEPVELVEQIAERFLDPSRPAP